MVSSIAAGLFDPIFLPLTLAPGGVFIRSGQALQSGVRLGAAAGSLEAVAEVAKQTQLTRTGLESLINIEALLFLAVSLALAHPLSIVVSLMLLPSRPVIIC